MTVLMTPLTYKRQMHSRQYDAPSPPDGGICHKLHEQAKTKQLIT